MTRNYFFHNLKKRKMTSLPQLWQQKNITCDGHYFLRHTSPAGKHKSLPKHCTLHCSYTKSPEPTFMTYILLCTTSLIQYSLPCTFKIKIRLSQDVEPHTPGVGLRGTKPTLEVGTNGLSAE